MPKRHPKHARGNNAWADAVKRAVRAIRPVLIAIGDPVASGAVQEVTKAVVGQLLQ